MLNRAAIELATAIGVGAISVAGIFEASGYRGASGYMPMAVTAFAAGLCAVWAVQSAVALGTGRLGTFTIPRHLVVRFALIVAIAVVYVLGITYTGFFTATVVMVPLLAFAIGYRNAPIAIGATAGFCLVLYGVFHLLLAIPMPPEIILDRLGL